MAKRKKASKPWILLHEIYMPLNLFRSQEGRRDVVQIVKMNQNGKIIQTKKIPHGMIRFFYGRKERMLQIDSELLSEFESIETIRHYHLPEALVTGDHAVVA